MLSAAFPPEITGAGTLYYELATSLVAMGHDVTVVTAQPRQRLGDQRLDSRWGRPLIERLRVDGLTVIRPATLPVPLDRPLLKGLDHLSVAASYLLAGLRAGRPDAILVYSPPLTFGVAGAWIGRLRRSPMVFNAQDLFPQYAIDAGILSNPGLIRFFRAMERYVYHRAEMITVHSEGNRDFLLRRGVPAEKIEVISNWADTDRITPGPRQNGFRSAHELGDRFVVSYAGTMGWAQDLDTLIECAAALRTQPRILFVLVGDGPRRCDLQARASALGLANVRFLPLQPPERYVELLAASDVSLISLNGRLSTPVVPGKLFDIMAAGRPVVAGVPLDGDAGRIVLASECGSVVPPGAPAQLAEAILTLLERQDLRETFGKNGRSHAELFYSRASATKAYERLLRRVSAAARSGTKEDAR